MTHLAAGPFTMSGPAFDADGLPFWQGDGTTGWQHPDVEQMALAMVAGSHGFDLIAYDKWLRALPASDANVKRELLDRRALAMDAMRDNNVDALLRHLEWLFLRQLYIRREDFLLPLAQLEAAWLDDRRKPRLAFIDAWIAEELRRDPTAKATGKALYDRAPYDFRKYVEERAFRERVRKVKNKIIGSSN